MRTFSGVVSPVQDIQRAAVHDIEEFIDGPDRAHIKTQFGMGSAFLDIEGCAGVYGSGRNACPDFPWPDQFPGWVPTDLKTVLGMFFYQIDEFGGSHPLAVEFTGYRESLGFQTPGFLLGNGIGAKRRQEECG